jgi:hypothetical protein
MAWKSIVLAAAMALAGCSAGGTPTPKTDAEKTALATEVAGLMSDPKIMDQMFDSVTTALMPMLDQACNAAPPDKAAECKKTISGPVVRGVMDEYLAESKALLPEMMKDMSAIMAATYSGEELARMKDFYGSPEGQSMLKKQPKVIAAYMPKVVERLQPLQREMMRKMQDRMRAWVAPPSPT